MLACSFLIQSSSKLLVTRTGIKAQSSSILGWIKPLISELLALEWQKLHTFELEYLWSQLVNLDQILCVASMGWGKGCIRFWGRLTGHIGLKVSDRCPLGYLFPHIASRFLENVKRVLLFPTCFRKYQVQNRPRTFTVGLYIYEWGKHGGKSPLLLGSREKWPSSSSI